MDKKLLKLSSEDGRFNHSQKHITKRRKEKVTYNYSEYFIKGNVNYLLWSFIRVYKVLSIYFNNSMNPSLKSASMLLEIQIIVTITKKFNMHKRIINHIIIIFLQTTRKQEYKKTQKLLKMHSTFEIFPSLKGKISNKKSNISSKVCSSCYNLTDHLSYVSIGTNQQTYCKISHEIKSLFKFNSSRYKAHILED